jgi:hypothetical protein
LNAVIGGLLVPAVKAQMDRPRERFNVAYDLLETLAASLWTYWNLAMRIAYYGSKGRAIREDYAAALKAWDSDEAWDNGGRIQIQISRSKRLLPETTHTDLDCAQRMVVEDLDKQVEHLRRRGARPPATSSTSAYPTKRDQIPELLFLLTQHLAIAQRARLIRWWLKRRKKTPDPIALAPKPIGDCAKQDGDRGNRGSRATGAGVGLGADDAHEVSRTAGKCGAGTRTSPRPGRPGAAARGRTRPRSRRVQQVGGPLAGANLIRLPDLT